MLDGELQNITRQQFIIEPLQPRVLLSATVAKEIVANDAGAPTDVLPAGEFVESGSPQEPVGDSADEPAAGEEVLMYTMLTSETDVPETQPQDTTLEGQVQIPAGDDFLVIYYSMMGEGPNVYHPLNDNPEILQTDVGAEGPNVFHPLNDNPEILQTGVQTTDAQNLQAPPPAQAAPFATVDAQPAVSRSVLSLDSRDLLASSNDVLV